jgi:hypothetical protein
MTVASPDVTTANTDPHYARALRRRKGEEAIDPVQARSLSLLQPKVRRRNSKTKNVRQSYVMSDRRPAGEQC